MSVLWNLTGNLNMGMVYRDGPEFKTNKRRWDYDPLLTKWTLRYDEEAHFMVPDAYGIGLSYRFASNLTLALRAGYYFRPDHRIYYTGDPADFEPGQYIQKGDDDHVGSAGVGFLIAPNVQMDLAVSIGDFATEGFVSMVYRLE